MVELRILDATSVTADGKTVTGPLHMPAASVTASMVTYGRGVVVVDAAGAGRVLPLTGSQMELLPFAVILFFVLGMIAGKWGAVQ